VYVRSGQLVRILSAGGATPHRLLSSIVQTTVHYISLHRRP